MSWKSSIYISVVSGKLMSAGRSCHSKREPLVINSDYVPVDSQPSGCVGSSMPKASLHVIPCTPLTRLPASQPTEKNWKNIYSQVKWCEGIVLELCRLDRVDMNKFFKPVLWTHGSYLDLCVDGWEVCGLAANRTAVMLLYAFPASIYNSLDAFLLCHRYLNVLIQKVARARKYDIHTLNNAHELAHLPLLMMTTFLGSNNASFGVGEVKYSGWHSSPSLQGHWALGSAQTWWRLTADWKHPDDHWSPFGPAEATSYHLQGRTCCSHLSIVGGCRVIEGRGRDLGGRQAVARSLERGFHHELWCWNQPGEQW